MLDSSIAAPRARVSAPVASAARGRSRVRVAFCIDSMGVGGTELNAVRTAERLDRSRFDLRVIALDAAGPLAARYAAAGIPVVSFPIRSLFGMDTLRQGRRLARYLANERIEVVHSHDLYNNVFATFAARAAGTPVIIASKRWWEWRRAHQLSNAAAYRFADCVLANSGSVAASLARADRVDPRRVTVVPNFVDEAAFAEPAPGERTRQLAALGVPADALVVGVVARLAPVKDHATLLRAAALLRRRWPQLHVVLVGDGPSRTELEALAAELDLADVIHFAGHRPQEPNPHRLFDVSALCSLHEGFPNSLVEAMAAARPVVATRVGGIPDAVRDGDTGLLVTGRSPERLAAALESLLVKPGRRARLGAAGQAEARVRFHVDVVIPTLEQLYDRLLNGARR